MTVDDLEKEKLKQSLREFLADPAVQRGLREMAEASRVSHRAQGDQYFQEGKLHEAIAEYRKDTELEITTYALAATVEEAYCHMGDAFQFLGDWEQAIAAYGQALEVWQAYGYGEMPLASLAAAHVELGQVDEAIRVCEEHPEEVDDPCVQRVLAEARRRKSGREPSPEPVPGCRRLRSPIYCVSTPPSSV